VEVHALKEGLEWHSRAEDQEEPILRGGMVKGVREKKKIRAEGVESKSSLKSNHLPKACPSTKGLLINRR